MEGAESVSVREVLDVPLPPMMDEGQARGEVATPGRPNIIGDADNIPAALSTLGVSP